MKHILFFILTSLTLNLLAQAPTEPAYVLKGHTNDVDGLSTSVLGYIATSGFDEKINVYRADSPYALIKVLGGHMGPINVVSFSRNGKLLASGGEDRLILMWDSAWRNTRRFEAHKDKINCLIFDNYGRYLFSGSDDRTMIVWDVVTGKSVKTINNNVPVTSIAPTNNFKYVYVSDAGPKIKLYDMMVGKIVKTLDGHTDIVNDIALSRNGKYLLSGSNDKTARLWDISTGKQVRIFPVDCWKVTTVAFSDDSKYAITGCNDGSVKIWEVASGKLVDSYELPGSIVRNVSFGKNNGELLAAYMLRNSDHYGLRIYYTSLGKSEMQPETEQGGTVPGNGGRKTNSNLKPNPTPAQRNNPAQKPVRNTTPKPTR
jgi:WD40 repeat protein